MSILKVNEKRKSTLNVLSLFSGCGGMDLGFEGDFDVLSGSVNMKINDSWDVEKTKSSKWVHLGRTRFQTVFANDIREDARNAWTRYFSKRGSCADTYKVESIVDIVKKEKKLGGILPTNVDIVTGGFPCQDFSVSGKRLGFSSDRAHDGKKITCKREPSVESRGQLYMWMREVISLTKPKLFVAENVKGLVNLSDVKNIIEEDFRKVCDNGYLVVEARVLHAADYGVPQSRERVIFFGFRKSALTKTAFKALSKEKISTKYDPYPIRTHSFTSTGDKLLRPLTLDKVFRGLKEPEESIDMSQQKYSKAKYMGKHCQGQSEVNLESIGPTIRSEHHGNIEYRRLGAEHGGKHWGELEKGLPERRLTVRECARIQTFPDDYEFVFSGKGNKMGVAASNAYKIIGNAVPPLLAYNIAKGIEDKWELYFGR